MGLIVQKFGGSSLADIERIQHVADIVAATREQGHHVVVVVSAMQGETDRLIQLAEGLQVHPNPREYDALMATGEQVSSALLSMALHAVGCSARSYTAVQAGILTNDCHRRAEIRGIDAARLRDDLKAGYVPVVTGFQGVDAVGDVTTIGRGGSDMTAVALAGALDAQECQIYTDVQGVYTTDPRVVKEARLLSHITFEEMLEMANMGAKVLQQRAVEYAHNASIPLRVLSSFQKGEGTLITANHSLPVEPSVSGIAFDRHQAKLTLLGVPNCDSALTQLLNAIRQSHIDVDMVVQNVPTQEALVDFSFTVHRDDYRDALTIAEGVASDLKAKELLSNDKIAKLSIVGLGMKTHASVASKMLQSLAEEEIHIHLITSSEVKISSVVDEVDLERGARTLHTAFELGK